ncbi:hypothetical protein OG711_39040 (plasmid) [Streptomyces uncialis]|uniref:hypothetical protein n=1 Tax=Streptomyces uncialis TaxID=1048205 RepID=UPI002E38238A|nr:hypothetical protein [Streptomyces uncialis]WTE16039.1 hypothetical protein OG924_37515 [Streptomyces uncialis]
MHDQPASRPQLSDDQAATEARRLIEAAYRPPAPAPTSYRDTSPLPRTGPTPPVPQPGRPPMSQNAADVSGLMLAVGIASVPVGGSVSLVLWTAGQTDPLALAVICAAPVALLAALSRVVKRAKEAREAAPPVIHQHYEGTVHQDHSSYTTETRGLIARTTNDNRR